MRNSCTLTSFPLPFLRESHFCAFLLKYCNFRKLQGKAAKYRVLHPVIGFVVTRVGFAVYCNQIKTSNPITTSCRSNTWGWSRGAKTGPAPSNVEGTIFVSVSKTATKQQRVSKEWAPPEQKSSFGISWEWEKLSLTDGLQVTPIIPPLDAILSFSVSLCKDRNIKMIHSPLCPSIYHVVMPFADSSTTIIIGVFLTAPKRWCWKEGTV